MLHARHALCERLATPHGRRVVHRDIKSANLRWRQTVG